MAFKGISFSATDIAGTYSFIQDESIMIGLQIANTGTIPTTVDVTLRGSYIMKGGEIPVGSSLSVLDGKIVCNNTDVLSVTTDTGESVDVTLSFLEV